MKRTQTALAYLLTEDEQKIAREVIPSYRLACDVRPGCLKNALDEAQDWTVAPDYLIIDVSGMDDPVEAMEQLADRAPEGETDVILVGERNDIPMYRQLCNIGVTDYLLKPLNGDELGEMLERVINRRREERGGIEPNKLMVVTGARGGVGASMVAGSLAYIIAERHHKRTLLVDLDLGGGTQYVSFEVEPTPGLVEILQSPKRVDALFLERTLARVSDRLSVLSTDTADTLEGLNEEGMDALLAQARQGIDTVVVDLPRQNPVGRKAFLNAGTVVIVSTLTVPSLRETVSMLELLERSGEATNIQVVVSRVGEHKGGVVPTQEFSRQIGREVSILPFDPRAATQAMIQAKPLPTYKRPIAHALMRLANKLPTAPTQNAGLFGRLLGDG